MTLRCVVIDDEKPARDRLRRLLGEHPDVLVVGEAADARAAIRLLDELAPDLCFLDVRMPEGDGFDVLGGARRLPCVIFTTAYDDYAVRAFEVNSIDYLLKPFSKRRLAEALERARRALGGSPAPAERILRALDALRRELGAREDGAPPLPAPGAPQRISARRGNRILLLAPADVLWFEAEETLVFAHAAQGRFLVERTLAELELELEPAFFRTHRRYLVNLERVAEIVPEDAGSYTVVLRDAARSSVPLSRRQARKLKERLPW